jgi:hypothetical protein
MTDVQPRIIKSSKSVAWRFLMILGLAALLCLQSGCDKKAPSVDQKFVNTYTELLIVEQMYGKDSPTARIKRKAILDSAGYSRDLFLKKANAILDDRDMWVPFQKAVIDRLDTLIEQNKTVPAHRRGED